MRQFRTEVRNAPDVVAQIPINKAVSGTVTSVGKNGDLRLCGSIDYAAAKIAQTSIIMTTFRDTYGNITVRKAGDSCFVK